MVSVLLHMGFGHHRGVLRPLFRTPYGLLGYQRSSAYFDLSVCHQSVYHFFVDLIGWPIRLPALLSLPRLSRFVDSLDSELWYHFGCRAAAWLQQHLGRWAVFRRVFTTRSALQG